MIILPHPSSCSWDQEGRTARTDLCSEPHPDAIRQESPGPPGQHIQLSCCRTLQVNVQTGGADKFSRWQSKLDKLQNNISPIATVFQPLLELQAAVWEGQTCISALDVTAIKAFSRRLKKNI